MRTYKNDIGKIMANTVPVLIEWLKKHNIPYDELYVGKPWCGYNGFYVDDKTIRPQEFLEMSYEQIQETLHSHREKTC
jgi:capsule biosynthesis phosphatase